MGDKGVKRDFAAHGLLNHARQLGAAFDATKSTAAPDATGNQLEGPRADLLPGTGYSDDDALTPAFVTTLQCGTHDLHIAYALKAEVHTAIGHLHDNFLNWFVKVTWVDAIGSAHDAGQIKFTGVGVYADDAPCPSQARTLHHGQADAAQTKDSHRVASLDFGGVANGAQAGGDAAAQQTYFLRVSRRVDFGEGHFSHHGVFAKGAGAHVME